MRARNVLISGIAILTALAFVPEPISLFGGIPDSAALAGTVSSKEEGAMEGVLVSAKRVGSTVTVTVVSDQQGRYRFPRTRLEPGQYALRIRAAGYELDGPGAAEVTQEKTAAADLRLRPAQNLASQLSNGEWMLSFPGTHEQKLFMVNCSGCHTLQRVVKSGHDVGEWMQVIRRMAGYAPGATPLLPQRRLNNAEPEGNQEILRKQAEYLSSINLSAVSQWQFPLKTLPRVKGRGTRVVITEYDLPRPESQPHDVVLDSDGIAWYADFGQQYLGRLDPKTAKVVEFPVPVLKPGSPLGILDVEQDKDGNLWLGMLLQGGIAKFDRKTQKFTTWSLPKDLNSDVAQQAMVMPAHSDQDGKVWMNNVGIRGLHRLDLSSGRFETFDPYRDVPRDLSSGVRAHSVYGLAADSQNNVYFLDFAGEDIGKVDAKTGKSTLYPTPTRNSGPRRGHIDSQERLWFAEFRGNRIAMFDTKTEHFQEWAVPEWAAPYDAILDKNEEVWSGGMSNDRILRLDPKTGQFTEYQLPSATNIRRVFVDNSTTPVTFWVGNNHGPSVIKLEPLD